jgi:hypothetical protein
MADKKTTQASSEPPLEQASSDARFSTYKENTDIPETNPPAGPHVIQELGVATEDK